MLLSCYSVFGIGCLENFETHHGKILVLPFPKWLDGQIGKFAECAGDLSYVQIACAAVFVSLNNSSIVSFCCATKISRLEPRLKFKVRGREIGCARQTFQSGLTEILFHFIIAWIFDETSIGPKITLFHRKLIWPKINLLISTENGLVQKSNTLFRVQRFRNEIMGINRRHTALWVFYKTYSNVIELNYHTFFV